MVVPYATPRARALGLELRAAREKRKLGVRELARLLGIAPGFLSNWERGVRLPKPEDVGAVLAHCRIVGEERHRIVEMARGAQETNWLGTSTEGAYLEWEKTATALFAWEPLLVHDLLQTSSYARIVLRSPGVENVERLVAARLARREVFERGKLTECAVVLGEAALRKRVGGPEVMADQLRYLRSVLEYDHIDLRIMPIDNDYHPGLSGAFSIFDFADLPTIVYEELSNESAHSSSTVRVRHYRSAAKSIKDLALRGDRARELIDRILRGLAE
jgi:hypothetical protein